MYISQKPHPLGGHCGPRKARRLGPVRLTQQAAFCGFSGPKKEKLQLLEMLPRGHEIKEMGLL